MTNPTTPKTTDLPTDWPGRCCPECGCPDIEPLTWSHVRADGFTPLSTGSQWATPAAIELDGSDIDHCRVCGDADIPDDHMVQDDDRDDVESDYATPEPAAPATTWTTRDEDGEYCVKLYIGGVYQTEADYFTDDRQDAHDTAESMIAEVARFTPEQISRRTAPADCRIAAGIERRAAERVDPSPAADLTRSQLEARLEIRTAQREAIHEELVAARATIADLVASNARRQRDLEALRAESRVLQSRNDRLETICSM